MHGRIVIPIDNERGELVAYAGPSIDGSEPKYKLPAGFKKNQVLYDRARALEEDR
jgi:DNA primase